MLFMLMATDADNSSQARLEARNEHLARLQELAAQGRLLLAGPTPMPDNPEEMSGSLIIADFESLDAAQEWAENDPYVHAGVYEEVLIRPFKKVLPE